MQMSHDQDSSILNLIQERLERSKSVELSSAKQFDRSGSFSAFGCCDYDDDEDSSASDTSRDAPWATAFEPFEVEEQSTEVGFLKQAYSKKERECEHLRQIIKELSQSRSKAHKTKVDLEEQFAGLQKEYYKVVKVSELARTVSQQAVNRAANLRSDLSAAQDQLRRTRRRAAAAEGRAKQLQDENDKLRQRVALLENARADDEGRGSACAREFLFSHTVTLY
eukprot:gene4070-4317_t